jgi:hypothetical protein
VLFYAVSSTSSTWICYNISLFVYKFITVVCCKSGFWDRIFANACCRMVCQNKKFGLCVADGSN